MSDIRSLGAHPVCQDLRWNLLKWLLSRRTTTDHAIFSLSFGAYSPDLSAILGASGTNTPGCQRPSKASSSRNLGWGDLGTREPTNMDTSRQSSIFRPLSHSLRDVIGAEVSRPVYIAKLRLE
jgi:hypothetical protein